jgi:hypothetical protein
VYIPGGHAACAVAAKNKVITLELVISLGSDVVKRNLFLIIIKTFYFMAFKSCYNI